MFHSWFGQDNENMQSIVSQLVNEQTQHLQQQINILNEQVRDLKEKLEINAIGSINADQELSDRLEDIENWSWAIEERLEENDDVFEDLQIETAEIYNEVKPYYEQDPPLEYLDTDSKEKDD